MPWQACTHAAAATFFSSATKYCQVLVLILGPALFPLPLVRQADLALSKQGEWLSWFWPRYDYQLFSWPWQHQPCVSFKASCISSVFICLAHRGHLPLCWQGQRYPLLCFSCKPRTKNGSSPTSEPSSGSLWGCHVSHVVTHLEPCGNTGWQLSSRDAQPTATTGPQQQRFCSPGWLSIRLCCILGFYLTAPVQTTGPAEGELIHRWWVCKRELFHPLGKRVREKETQAEN